MMVSVVDGTATTLIVTMPVLDGAAFAGLKVFVLWPQPCDVSGAVLSGNLRQRAQSLQELVGTLKRISKRGGFANHKCFLALPPGRDFMNITDCSVYPLAALQTTKFVDPTQMLMQV